MLTDEEKAVILGAYMPEDSNHDEWLPVSEGEYEWAVGIAQGHKDRIQALTEAKNQEILNVQMGWDNVINAEQGKLDFMSQKIETALNRDKLKNKRLPSGTPHFRNSKHYEWPSDAVLIEWGKAHGVEVTTKESVSKADIKKLLVNDGVATEDGETIEGLIVTPVKTFSIKG